MWLLQIDTTRFSYVQFEGINNFYNARWANLTDPNAPWVVLVFFWIIFIGLVCLALFLITCVVEEIYKFIDKLWIKPMNYSGTCLEYERDHAYFRRTNDRQVFHIYISDTNYFDIQDAEDNAGDDGTPKPVYVFSTKKGRFSKHEYGYSYVKLLSKKTNSDIIN